MIIQDKADLIWSSYANRGFHNSSEQMLDSGFYRAGEVVDNVSEFYQPLPDYVASHQPDKEQKFLPVEEAEEKSDNGTSSTDIELSERVDKSCNFSVIKTGEYHSLNLNSINQGEGLLQSYGSLSVTNYEELDFAERRRRRESFV